MESQEVSVSVQQRSSEAEMLLKVLTLNCWYVFQCHCSLMKLTPYVTTGD